ncbi:MAG: DUF2914 domain-containing protein [Desulfobulbus sp.]|uniref:DUF2914 domain-containing protein n=1 Tax=Desulfobulbus sp. TaxID=895 RepID=UPI002847E5C2|nr:DUF2914 domain-containing protein [Desulfobulbus sp.]MDR2548790.1 DUF2914 domain-containing protein [Desulfobulbus sp.]
MHRLLRIFFLVPAMCLAIFSYAAHAQQLVTVEKFQWTDTVDRGTRQYGKIFASPVKTKELYCWVQLKGSPELLEKLRNTPDGKYFIRHEWYRYGVDRVSADLNVGIPLSVGREEDLNKLSYEVDAKGYFYWRVWSGKKRLSRGWWRVDIVDHSGSILQCPSDRGAKPCSFDIRVQ